MVFSRYPIPKGGPYINTVRDLIDFLNSRGLSNPIRLGIMISLYNTRRLFYSDLLKNLEIGKSNLTMNLQFLSEANYIRVRKLPTVTGVKTVVEITREGIDVVDLYFDIVESLRNNQ